MKVLIVWGESLAKPGGGTAHWRGLAEGLVQAGHDVITIAPRYRGAEPQTNQLDVRWVWLPLGRTAGFGLLQLLTVILMPLWLMRHRPDVVYVRACFFQGIMSLITRLAGVPLVSEVDSVVDEEVLMRGQPRWIAAVIRGLDCFNNRLLSGMVCVSRGLRDVSIRRGGPRHATVAIPNGAPTRHMKPADRLAARKQLGLDEEAVIIGFAALDKSRT